MLLSSIGCSLFRTVEDDSPEGTIKRFKKLPEDTLIKYTRNGTPYQKISAYKALVANKSTKSFNVLLEHLHDSNKIEWIDGCMIDSIFIFDAFIESTTLTKDNCDSTDEVFNCMMKDSLYIIFLRDSAVSSEYGNIFITQTPTTDKFYQLLRNVVLTRHDVRALVALSNYRNPNDIPLMFDYLFKTYDTIPYKFSTTWYRAKIELNYIKTKEKVE